jgi:hypothetical protein
MAAGCPIEPVGIAQTGRELDHSITNPVFDQRQALLGPRLVPLQDLGGHEFEDRRLHGVQRGKHPGDGPGSRIGIVREQARVVLGDVEDDRACLKQGKVAVLIGRNQGSPTSSSAQRTRVSRAKPTPLGGETRRASASASACLKKPRPARSRGRLRRSPHGAAFCLCSHGRGGGVCVSRTAHAVRWRFVYRRSAGTQTTKHGFAGERAARDARRRLIERFPAERPILRPAPAPVRGPSLGGTASSSWRDRPGDASCGAAKCKMRRLFDDRVFGVSRGAGVRRPGVTGVGHDRA